MKCPNMLANRGWLLKAWLVVAIILLRNTKTYVMFLW